jgi:hypothetical protein
MPVNGDIYSKKIQINGITLTPPQQALFNFAGNNKNFFKYIICNWSRQQGKTTIIIILLLKWIFEKYHNTLYVSPTLKLSKNIYKTILSIIPDKSLIRSQNSQELIIETCNGGKLMFCSAQSPDSIRGNTFDYAVIDEAAFCNEGSENNNLLYNIIMPTLKVRGKKLVLISTPFGKQGFFFDMAQKAITDTTGNYKYLKYSIIDDGLIPEKGKSKYISNLRNTTPELVFRQEYMCEFIDDALSYFKNFDKCFDFEGDLQSSDNQQFEFCGIDLSAQGGDETLFSVLTKTDKMAQFVINGTLDIKYKRIADLINSHPELKNVYIEVNGIGSPMINEIKKLVKNKSVIQEWLTTNDSKTEIINDLALSIDRNEVHFNRNDKELRSEFSTFIYKVSKNRKLTFGAKNGFHDDRIMSAAICLRAKKDGQHKGTLSYHFVN